MPHNVRPQREKDESEDYPNKWLEDNRRNDNGTLARIVVSNIKGMRQLPTEKRVMILNMLVEGMSMRSR